MKIDKTKFFIGLFFVGIFLLFFLTPLDPDLGWHLRCGEMFWSSGSFCSVNTFSVLLSGYTWPNHAWAYEAILFPIFNLGGFFGLSLFNSLIILGSVLLLYFGVKKKKTEKIFLIALVFLFGGGTFFLGIRSQIIGILFFALEIFLLLRSNENEKMFYFIPLVLLAWANFHGSVIVGILVFIFYILRKIIFEEKDFIKNLGLAFSSILLPLINPFGFQIYIDAWRHFAVVDLGKLIAEWTPPSFWVVFFAALFGFFILYLCFYKRNWRYRVLSLLVLGFFYTALRARRNIPFYFMILFLVYFSLQEKRGFFGDLLNYKNFRKVFFVLISIFVLWVLIFSLPANLKSDFNYNSWCQKSVERNLNYPCSASEFLLNKSPGNIFNAYEWGGFLIWKIPQNKIFVDGRMPSWETPSGLSPYTIYLKTIQTQPGWQETLKEYNFSYLLIGSGTFMDLELQKNFAKEGWKEEYRDSISVVWEKTNLSTS